MKLRIIFILLLLSFGFTALVLDVIYISLVSEDIYSDQIERYLTSVIDINKEKISDFINEINMGISFLAKSRGVNKILTSEVVESREAAILDVDGQIYVIAREIENYLFTHPNMTLKELQSSKEFQNIAVQQIGETGYSMILDDKNFEIYFYVESSRVGMTREDILNNSENAFYFLDEIKDYGFAKGFYNWTDVYGARRSKYLEGVNLEVTTKDNIGFIVLTTAYIDDYSVVNNVSKELDNYFKKFTSKREYFNIMFISSDDNIIYMTQKMAGLGIYFEKAAKKIMSLDFFRKKMKRENVMFFGPFIEENTNDLYLMAMLEVYDDNEKIGSIMLIKSINKINDILSEEDGENYLVNNKAMLITPLKSRDVDLLVQDIRTEIVEECLNDFKVAKKLNISVNEYNKMEIEEGEREDIGKFLDFKGDYIFGLEIPIDVVNWCLISEISVKNALNEPMKKNVWYQILFRSGIFVVFTILVIFGSFFIDKKYVFKRKNKKRLMK